MSQYITKNKSTGAQGQQEMAEERIAYLEEENSYLRQIIEHIPGNLFWKNTNNIYLGCNRNQADILGLSSPDEIVGKSTEECLGKKAAMEVNEADLLILSSGKECYFEEEGWDEHNQKAVYLTKKIPLFDANNNPVGLIGSAFNITDRKNMEMELKIAKEKAESSDRAKTQFLAMMNHELNTPLGSIIGLIDLIKQGCLSAEEEQSAINTIETCSHYLLGLVNEVLDFSRLDNNHDSLNMNTVNITELMNEAYNLLQIPAHNKGLELQLEFIRPIRHPILINHRALLQILINLANNAIKFTEKGQVSIRVNALQKKTSTALEIAVTDTGCGIPADKLDYIFEPFKQLDNNYIRQSSRHGTGLGLAIVKKLLAKLGMQISVSSSLGNGSTFTIRGKFKTSHAKPHLSAKNTTPNKEMLAIKKEFRILLVEDDPVIQYIHRKMLEEYKCNIDIAPNGREAIRLFDQHDIAFVDVTLPDINGFEVIKALREKSKMPIVALTAHTGEIERKECLKAGANRFESKPISRETLREILVKYVGKK